MFGKDDSCFVCAGLKGAPGPAGETRFVLIKGDQGLQGLPGINGFPGPRGEKAASGCYVKQGEAGSI